jgi:hypothetical protein
MYIVGGVFVVGGLAILKKELRDYNKSNLRTSAGFGAFCIGSGCFIVSYFISLSKQEYLKSAKYMYNC